jgi:hypothetical protein
MAAAPSNPVASNSKLAGSGTAATSIEIFLMPTLAIQMLEAKQRDIPCDATTGLKCSVWFEQGAVPGPQGLSPWSASRLRAITSKLPGSNIHEIDVISASENVSKDKPTPAELLPEIDGNEMMPIGVRVNASRMFSIIAARAACGDPSIMIIKQVRPNALFRAFAHMRRFLNEVNNHLTSGVVNAQPFTICGYLMAIPANLSGKKATIAPIDG